jgi:hypothetical protein
MKTSKIAKVLLSFVMAISTVAYANDIYIEQVGDSSTINITQDGTGNRIGDSTTPSFIGGGSNVVNIDQVGSNNQLDFVVNGASAALTINTTGSGNIQTVDCGTLNSAGCSGSTITQTIVGDDNTVTQSLGTGANHTSNVSITGDTNTVTHTSTNGATTSADITVSGNLNTIGVTQSGMVAKSVTVNSTGNSNNISITQSD